MKMLLRSSSTPILGSLLPSSSSPHFNENLNNSNNNHLISLEKSSSSPSLSSSSLLRTQSDRNLHSLLSSHRPTHPGPDTIPSFSVYNLRDQEDEDNGEEEEDQFDEEGKGVNVIGRGISRGFSFMGLNQNLNLVGNFGDNGDPSGPLFLARGLGIDRLGSGLLSAAAGGGCGGNGGGERSDIEMYYKRMVEENPSNGLFLSNYAQFLYKTKGDAKRAEEYYSRAILAEPGDGEILSQYAKLVWELHRDEERASSYFEQAVQATPYDSHVLAAYANFLWTIEENDRDSIGEDGTSQDYFETAVRHEIVAQT